VDGWLTAVDLTGHYSNPRVPLDYLADQAQRAIQSPLVTPISGTAPHPAVQGRLRPDEVAQLVEQYKAGATERELSARLGIHRSTVAAHLERAGVPTRRGRGLQPDEINDAARLYADGWSALRLSRKYGVSDHTLTAALRKAGVAISPRGRSARRGAGPVGRHGG
jgi:lambda repressor-like predicted transcriptional regulator